MRNSKFSLIVSMLSLSPMLATAMETDAGNFVTTRSDSVSIQSTTTVELPVLRDSGRNSPLLADVTQTYYIGNWTGALVYSLGALTGSSVPAPLPSPLNFSTPYSYSAAAQALVPPSTAWSQAFGYTTNPADPTGAAKSCVWQVNVSITNGVCAANVTMTAYGNQGGLCLLDNNSGVDPTNCQLVVGVGLQ
jgi:hypothetical protein